MVKKIMMVWVMLLSVALGAQDNVQFERSKVIATTHTYEEMSQLAKDYGFNNIKVLKGLSQHMGRCYAVLESGTFRADILEQVDLMSRASGVLDVSANAIFTQKQIPNDTYWTQLWGMNKISAPAAWDITTGSSDVVVAVIDSGITYTHSELSPNMWSNPGEIAGNGVDDDGNGYVDDIHGWNAIDENGDPADGLGHGTHCAGTIGAVGNNSNGVAGVCWNVKLMAVKCFSNAGTAEFADILECYDYVITMKQRGINIVVTNNSYGIDDWFGQPQYDAIKVMGELGIIASCASGNGGTDWVGDNVDITPHYPSCMDLPCIISVASTDSSDYISTFSNYGAVTVDLAAPGTGIYSCYQNSYYMMSGTSFATPHVAGAVALLAAHKPEDTLENRIYKILNGVDPVSAMSGKCVTGGRLNVYASLNVQKNVTARFDYISAFESMDVSFVDESVALDSSIGSWSWNFGDGSPLSSMKNPSHTYAVPGTYSVSLTVTNNTSPAESDTVTHEVMVPKPYCIVKSADAEYEWIESIQIGSFSKQTGSSAPAGYEDWTSEVIDMEAGQTYAVSLTPGYQGGPWNEYWRIWIDYNRDGEFDPVAELAYDGGASQTTLNGSFTLPTGLASVVTRMRITMGWVEDSSSAGPEPCQSVNAGETEDYTVNLIGDVEPTNSDDFLGSFSGAGIWTRNSDSKAWSRMLGDEASQIALGDFDGDGKDDLIGVWPVGIWIQYTSGTWEKVLNTDNLIWLSAGDMNGDGKDDILGSWSFGVWYRDTASGLWTRLHDSAAGSVTAGDLDGDGKDDLVGVWSGAGIWERLSGNGTWTRILGDQNLIWLTTGDMNGDGKDDILGSWNHGVYALDSATGNWTRYHDAAQQITAGDLDGDGVDDIIGLWNGIGVWVRYATGSWEKIHASNVISMDTGKMR